MSLTTEALTEPVYELAEARGLGCRQIARELGVSVHRTRTVLARLRREGRLPERPATGGPNGGDKPLPPGELERRAAEIREHWSDDEELRRRARGRRVEWLAPSVSLLLDD